jgi:hypothetical protein
VSRPSPVRIRPYELDSRQEGRWVLARHLRAGDAVLLRRGSVVVLESVRLDDVEERVYNFHVAELQNYAVGGCGVLVHNVNDPAGNGRTPAPEGPVPEPKQGELFPEAVPAPPAGAPLSPAEIRGNLKAYADAYARRVRAKGNTYNGLWEDVQNDVGGGRPLSDRAKSEIRDYIKANTREYGDVQPQMRNEFGKAGNPAHQGTIRDRLKEMAKKEFPNGKIHEGDSIKDQPGTGGLDRQPDVWVEDPMTGRVLKVYEAARKDGSGQWVQRELDKLNDYNRLGIPSHFEEVPE